MSPLNEPQEFSELFGSENTHGNVLRRNNHPPSENFISRQASTIFLCMIQKSSPKSQLIQETIVDIYMTMQ